MSEMPKCEFCWFDEEPPKRPEMWHTPEEHTDEDAQRRRETLQLYIKFGRS